MNWKLVIFDIVLILLITGVAFALLTSNKVINTTGIISAVGIEVYSDSTLTTVVNSIDWGTLNPNGHTTLIFFIKNIQTQSVILSETTQNWNPSNAANFITFTWNYTSTTIIPVDGVICVTFTNTVSGSISGITSYSYNIVITATQV